MIQRLPAKNCASREGFVIVSGAGGCLDASPASGIGASCDGIHARCAGPHFDIRNAGNDQRRPHHDEKLVRTRRAFGVNVRTADVSEHRPSARERYEAGQHQSDSWPSHRCIFRIHLPSARPIQVLSAAKSMAIARPRQRTSPCSGRKNSRIASCDCGGC